MLRALFATTFAAAGVLLLMPLAVRALRAVGAIDVPNARSSHSRPTPRGAGLVTGVMMTVAFGIAGGRLDLALAVVAILATALGGLEDVRGTRVAARLAGQTIIGAVFIFSTRDLGASLSGAATAAVVVFVVGYTNAFNFMDGINGISAVTAIVAGASFALLGQLSSVPELRIVGAIVLVVALSFLPFNFPGARVFLGDSGSYSFGAVIGCAAVAGLRFGVRADAILAPLAIYLVDSGTVLVRRAAKRKSLGTPHREHTYQKLSELGASHTRSTGAVLACSTLTAGLGLAIVGANVTLRAALDALIIAVAGLYLCLPRAVAHHQAKNRSEGP
jgi:UDP-GlcNAc:undecaprenyl-phosphate GlcNAc-1-phosphate transferase